MLAVLRSVCQLATILMIALMVIMITIMNSLVLTRYVFAYSPAWTEEVTRYAMIWLVMLGAGVLALFDDHITLNMLVEKLPPRIRALQRLLVQAFVSVTALVIAWKGYEFAWGLKGVVMPALQRSMALAAYSVPIGATMIAVFAMLRMLVECADLFGIGRPALPDQAEFMDNSFKPVDETAGHGTTAGSVDRGSA